MKIFNFLKRNTYFTGKIIKVSIVNYIKWDSKLKRLVVTLPKGTVVLTPHGIGRIQNYDRDYNQIWIALSRKYYRSFIPTDIFLFKVIHKETEYFLRPDDYWFIENIGLTIKDEIIRFTLTKRNRATLTEDERKNRELLYICNTKRGGRSIYHLLKKRNLI
jgi:hypothetical protein